MTASFTWPIDANVVSEIMRTRPEPRVAAFLDSIADEGLGLASVTVWEILDGIGRLAPGRSHSSRTGATTIHTLGKSLPSIVQRLLKTWTHTPEPWELRVP